MIKKVFPIVPKPFRLTHSENNTLVILTPGFPESDADTTCLPMLQSFVRNMKTLYPKGNIIVLSFQYPYHTKTYQWFDITVISFNGKNKGGLARLSMRRKLNTTLKKINNSTKIAGLLSFWYGECAWVGKRFADKNALKHYCWILGQDAKKENKYPERLRVNANELVALSDFLQDEFEKNHGTRPQYLIPPGIDTKEFRATRKEKNIDILGAGSLIALKQYDIFIEIIAEIKKSIPAIKAMLIGDGPEKEKLQMLITKYGLQESIILAGELPHDEVLALMQHSKILLHPSSYEGFAGVCMEALHAGAHVISFSRAMKPEIEHWHIVQNKTEMKQEILSILQNGNTNYSSVTPFLMNDTARSIAKLFDQ